MTELTELNEQQGDYETNERRNFPNAVLQVAELNTALPGEQVLVAFPDLTRTDGKKPSKTQARVLFSNLLSNIAMQGGRYVTDVLVPREDGKGEERYMTVEKLTSKGLGQVITEVGPEFRSIHADTDRRRVTGKVMLETQQDGNDTSTQFVILE